MSTSQKEIEAACNALMVEGLICLGILLAGAYYIFMVIL